MKPWRIMLGLGLALLGLPTVQAQETIDIRKITCSEFLAGRVTDSRSLAIWLNGYLSGARGKTLPTVCVSHTNTPVLDAARDVVGADK
jgi:hypothetical protein